MKSLAQMGVLSIIVSLLVLGSLSDLIRLPGSNAGSVTSAGSLSRKVLQHESTCLRDGLRTSRSTNTTI